MTCKRITTNDGKLVGFACSRGSRRRVTCSVEGCNARGEYLCDYPLEGAREGLTCDRPLCRRHAKLVKHDTHYCPPHARLTGGKPI